MNKHFRGTRDMTTGKKARSILLSIGLLYAVILTIWREDAGTSFYILSVGFVAGLLGALIFIFAAMDELKSIARDLADEQTALPGSIDAHDNRLV